MSEQPQPQRVPQTMPEDGGGWHRVDAGPHLHVMFHPNRRLLGREPDDIERPSIVVAVAGKREQSLRFDPFSAGSHYHIRPRLRGRQIPLWVDEGQKPLDVALKFFEKPLRFRGLLAQAEEDDVASQLNDADLANAARQIRELYAAARHIPVA
jgi:phytoene dehydrogenase-like protein